MASKRIVLENIFCEHFEKNVSIQNSLKKYLRFIGQQLTFVWKIGYDILLLLNNIKWIGYDQKMA